LLVWSSSAIGLLWLQVVELGQIRAAENTMPDASAVVSPLRPKVLEPGLPALEPGVERYVVHGGGMVVVAIEPGDVVEIVDLEGRQAAELILFSPAGREDAAALGARATHEPSGLRRILSEPGEDAKRVRAALERRGLEILIVSLRHPTDARRHPVHDEIRAPLLYLPEYLLREPLRVFRAWWHMRRFPSYSATFRIWLQDLTRDPTPNRIRRFGQALVLAAELPAGVDRLHAHFLHTPASVTRYAALLRGLPWSASAHAKDIWTTPEWEKREKLASCDWLVTCTAANREHLAALAPAGRVELVYHGLDSDKFKPPAGPVRARDGRNAADPVVILSVGRLVEKKGTDVLLEALARIPAAVHWKFVHVGSGPLKSRAMHRARRLGISSRVEWRGALTQERVLAEYRNADLFALASRVARDGDRDGLPNVLLEAQSQGLACVATRVSAIPELLRDGQTGLLVEENHPAALARAIEALIVSPARRRALGQAGQARVAEVFGLDSNIEPLARRFGLAAGANRVLRTA
jgi:glycosyltransferase involved in cell wall biosynthesis